jgi:hypothetical protein
MLRRANAAPRALSCRDEAISSASRRNHAQLASAAMMLDRYRNAGLALLAFAAIGPAAAAELNDYPTEARAEFVFACMKTNGDTQVALRQCSCSIDVIASILPYERYVSAQTVLSLSQVPGRFGTMFQTPEPTKVAVNDLRRAQAEAEIRCF